MKTKMILFAIFTMVATLCVSQTEAPPQAWTVGEIINMMPTQSAGFQGRKEVKFDPTYSYFINNNNNAIPDRLYDNVQLTQYTHSEDPELWGESFRQFAISNSTNVLLVVSFGGATDWRTDVACIISPSGQVLSTLEVAVSVMEVWVKQFRIEQNQIIVTTIIPNSTTSIPFGTFTSFSGYRKDVTYSINAQSQFVQNSVLTYQSKVYTRSSLQNTYLNL